MITESLVNTTLSFSVTFENVAEADAVYEALAAYRPRPHEEAFVEKVTASLGEAIGRAYPVETPELARLRALLTGDRDDPWG